MQTGNTGCLPTPPSGEGVILTGFDTEAVLTQHVETKNRLSEEVRDHFRERCQDRPRTRGSIRVNATKVSPIFLDANARCRTAVISDSSSDTSTVSLGFCNL